MSSVVRLKHEHSALSTAKNLTTTTSSKKFTHAKGCLKWVNLDGIPRYLK